MTDKRLKEIKDSIDLQLEVAKVMGLNHILKEEKELYDYVEELRKKLKEKDEGFKAVNEELCEYAEENEKLKKQLEEEKRSHEYDERIVEQHCDFVDEHYRQQKGFIEYLTQFIENEQYCYLAEKREDRVRKDILEEILQKYKEIIGGSDEIN